METGRTFKGNLQSRVNKSRKDKRSHLDTLLQGFNKLKVKDDQVQENCGQAEPEENDDNRVLLLNAIVKNQVSNGKESTSVNLKETRSQKSRRLRQQSLDREMTRLATETNRPTVIKNEKSNRTFMDDWLNSDGQQPKTPRLSATYFKIKEEPSEESSTSLQRIHGFVNKQYCAEKKEKRRLHRLNLRDNNRMDSLTAAFGGISIGRDRSSQMRGEGKIQKKPIHRSKRKWARPRTEAIGEANLRKSRRLKGLSPDSSGGFDDTALFQKWVALKEELDKEGRKIKMKMDVD